MANSKKQDSNNFKLYLTHNRIKVRDIHTMIQFYVQHFGMKVISKLGEDKPNNYPTCFLGYRGKYGDKYNTTAAFLELSSNSEDKNLAENNPQQNQSRINCEGKYSVYWKIGINVHDIEHAAQRLKSRNVKVDDTLDIPDVGILCHVYDDEGYDTELMQFTMSGKQMDYVKNEDSTLGQSAVFSVITIRVRDIEKTLSFYQNLLGMKLLCKQDQSSDYGFEVYYLGFTDENPPNLLDPNDIINREWTYQRPYTLLEIEVYTQGKQPECFVSVGPDEFGFLGIGTMCSHLDSFKAHIGFNNATYPEITMKEFFSDIFQTSGIIIKDPDGVPIRVLQIT